MLYALLEVKYPWVLLHFVAHEASKDGLKVLLTGEGVDAIFGGLPKYRYLKPTSQQPSR